MTSKAHRRFPRWLTTMMVSLLAFIFILSLPLTMPVALVLNYLHKQRMLKAAKKFACGTCGQILGIEAIAEADQEWAEHVRVLRKKHPGTRFRLARRVHAICSSCKTKYTYLSKKQTFIIREQFLGSLKTSIDRQ